MSLNQPVYSQFNHERPLREGGGEEKRRNKKADPGGDHFPWIMPFARSLVKTRVIVGLRSQRSKLRWLRYHVSEKQFLDLAPEFLFDFEGIHLARHIRSA